MNKPRKLMLNKNYIPSITSKDDEVFSNGIFKFNISRMMEHIITGKLGAEKELINIAEWFKMHNHNPVNEDHLSSVDITKPVLQAEIRPGIFQIIDGNHRVEKACRDKVDYIKSYKLKGEQLIAYFIDLRGYNAFIEYWNSKL